jgi:Tti2 family
LILLDSSLPSIRLRAITILSNILDRIDESVLRKMGLAEVIWTALIPNLSSLPPITDLDESVLLIKATYPALIKLSKLWQPSLANRVQLLDKLVRDGVIYSMVFAADKLRVAQVELEALELLVNEMGIYFVKHLKVYIFHSKLSK